MLYEILCFLNKTELMKLSLISQHTSHLIYSHFLSSTIICRQLLHLKWIGTSKNFLSRPYASFELQPFSASVAYKYLRFKKTYIRICSADNLLEDLEPLKHLWNGMRLSVEIPTSISAEYVDLLLKSLANKPNQLEALFLESVGETATSTYQLTSLLNPLTIGCKGLYLDGILCEASAVAEYLHYPCSYSKSVMLSKNIKITEEYVSDLFELIKQQFEKATDACPFRFSVNLDFTTLRANNAILNKALGNVKTQESLVLTVYSKCYWTITRKADPNLERLSYRKLLDRTFGNF